MTRTTHATWMLVLINVFWGLSFPLTKDWMEAAKGCPGDGLVASATFLALRAPLAFVMLAAWQPRLVFGIGRRAFGLGVIIGSLQFTGSFLQTTGMETTSPALSAFITSVGSAWVPLVGWLMFRLPTTPIMLAGLAVALVGAGVLTGADQQTGFGLGLGEALTLLATVFFSVMIVLLDRWGRVVPAAELTCGSLLIFAAGAVVTCAIVVAPYMTFIEWLEWTKGLLGQPKILAGFLVITICSSVLATHWINVYQPRVTASRAALIYFLEPVFASCMSLVFEHDSLTWRLAAGGGLILAGNLLAELPRLRGGRNPTSF